MADIAALARKQAQEDLKAGRVPKMPSGGAMTQNIAAAIPDTTQQTSPAWAPPVDVAPPSQMPPVDNPISAVPQGVRQGILPAVFNAGSMGPVGALRSMAGEVANQALGVTQGPDPNAIAAQGEAGLIGGPLAMAGVKLMGRALPAAMNKAAAEKFGALLGSFAPKVSGASLLQNAEKSGLSLALPETLALAGEKISSLRGAGQTAEWKNVASYLEREVKNRITTNNGELTAADVISLHQGLGDKYAKAKGGKDKQALKAIYDSLGDEVEALMGKADPTSHTAQQIKDGWQAYKRKATLNELEQMGQKATKPISGAGDEVKFNAAEVLRNMQNNRFYKSAFTEPEKKEIETLLTGLNTIGGLKAAVGANVGSHGIMQMALGGGLGASVGANMGGGWGTTAATALGMAIPPIATTLKNIGIAMETGIGRQLFRELVKGGHGRLTGQAASVLAAFAAAQEATPGSAQAIQGGP